MVQWNYLVFFQFRIRSYEYYGESILDFQISTHWQGLRGQGPILNPMKLERVFAI